MQMLQSLERKPSGPGNMRITMIIPELTVKKKN
jgi:hypothetical protein